MSIAAPVAEYTPEDLLKMPDANRFELIDGHLVERNMSMLATFVTARISRLLGNHCEDYRAGWVFSEGASYQCFPHAPGRVRRADISLFRGDRHNFEDLQLEGHCRYAPDLAVEVVSPNDQMYEVHAKVQEWLDAGVQLVWVVNPLERLVEIHRATGGGTILKRNDEITGEEVIPGFHCPISEFFETPAAKTSTP